MTFTFMHQVILTFEDADYILHNLIEKGVDVRYELLNIEEFM